MTETVSAGDLAPEQAIAQTRQIALLFLAYALARAAKAGLSPEEAVRLFKELRPQPRPAVATAAEVERVARDDALFMSLLHGRASIEKNGDRWSISVPLEDDRAVLESFTTLDYYIRWGAEFDRDLFPGVRWDTWRDGDTYRFELRLADAP
ncbi:MAG: hypothetical protein M3T56_05920 [Chloroflexota bacterium]|nr:hypothetical protein [Chloroflexota bacterium]